MKPKHWLLWLLGVLVMALALPPGLIQIASPLMTGVGIWAIGKAFRQNIDGNYLAIAGTIVVALALIITLQPNVDTPQRMLQIVGIIVNLTSALWSVISHHRAYIRIKLPR